jgi:hypothetical protein
MFTIIRLRSNQKNYIIIEKQGNVKKQSTEGAVGQKIYKHSKCVKKQTFHAFCGKVKLAKLCEISQWHRAPRGSLVGAYLMRGKNERQEHAADEAVDFDYIGTRTPPQERYAYVT